MTSVSNIITSETVALPGWCGIPFECELRRPSLLTLASKGAITNPLMKTARRIFFAGISAEDGNFAEEARILVEIARAALVHPSFAELENNGIELTDEQLIAIFQYTQLGAKALARFRGLTTDDDAHRDGTAVSDTAE